MLEKLISSELAKPVVAAIISMLPISELRGGIPIAITIFKFPVFKAFIICVISNILIAIPILLFLESITKFLMKFKFSGRLLQRLFERTKSRTGIIEKYKILGLALFVGIPLPITGAWTGSIAASILNMKFKDAIMGICIGVLMAGIIITTLTLFGIWGTNILLH